MRKLFLGSLVAIMALVMAFSFKSFANADPSITISPDSNITNSEKVTVTGSGFASDIIGGTLFECNSAANQPTITIVYENTNYGTLPVSCSSPLPSFGAIFVAPTNGSFSTSFTVTTGVVGPPTTGTDTCVNDPSKGENCTLTKGSAGYSGDATTDAESFPCPPTAAQIAAGDTCQVNYGYEDASGNSSSVVADIPFATSNTSGGSNGGSAAGGTSQSGNSNSNGSSASQLVNTGPGSNAALAAVIAAAIVSGLYLFNVSRKNKA